jgi:hypothetical protein
LRPRTVAIGSEVLALFLRHALLISLFHVPRIMRIGERSWELSLTTRSGSLRQKGPSCSHRLPGYLHVFAKLATFRMIHPLSGIFRGTMESCCLFFFFFLFLFLPLGFPTTNRHVLIIFPRIKQTRLPAFFPFFSSCFRSVLEQLLG